MAVCPWTCREVVISGAAGLTGEAKQPGGTARGAPKYRLVTSMDLIRRGKNSRVVSDARHENRREGEISRKDGSDGSSPRAAFLDHARRLLGRAQPVGGLARARDEQADAAAEAQDGRAELEDASRVACAVARPLSRPASQLFRNAPDAARNENAS